MNVALTHKEFTEGPWALPHGWCWVAISDVIQKIQTLDPRQARTATAFDYIDLSALSDGAVVGAQRMLGKDAPSRARQVVEPKDTLLSCVRVYLENVGLVGDALVSPVASTAFCVLRSNGATDPRYLNYFVRSRRFVQWLIPLQRGNSPPAVVDSDVKSRPLPLPPLAEQRRIVERIDALFEEIAEGERALDAARKGLETYRRALLRAAVTGELTADWRSHCNDGASAADLLARLRSRYPEERPTIARWSAAASLPTIPDSWTWCAVAEAGEVQLGRQRAPQHHAGDHMRPYLRVANVLEDHFDLTDVKAMNFTPAEFETFELRTGDILLNEGQAPDLLGRSAIYNGEIPGCCFQKTLLRFRAKEGVNPAYAQLVFRHYMHSGRFKRESRITTNIGHLTQVRFVVMEFPLPPSLEQDAIAALFGELDAALGELDPIATDAVRLRQSVLKVAFEGRLVPQDEGDEPAAMMLARLAASQEQAPRSRRGRPSKHEVAR